MSIKMLCPVCGASYDLDDSQEGKRVRCRTCEEMFTVKAPRPKKKADDEDEDSRTRRAPRPSRVRDDEDEDDRPRRRRSRDDDEDEDDRPRRRTLKKSGSGTVWVIVGSIAAVFLLVCGGGGLAVYLIIKSAVEEEQARLKAAQQQGAGGPGPVVGQGGPGQVNDGDWRVVPPAQAQAIRSVDDALAALQEKERWRQDDALRWLSSDQPDPGRRAEVVAALEPMVRQRKGSGGDADINALAAWGGKDSLPTLIDVLRDAGPKGPVPGGDHVRIKAVLRALGNLKDPQAAPALVEEWYVYPEGGDTAWALRLIGPAAEKDILPFFDSPNDMTRNAARDVIRAYGTKDDVIFERVMTDMADKDWARRGAAASWLADGKPTDARRAKVVKALDGMLTNALDSGDTNFGRDIGNGKILRQAVEPAANAMVKWAGKDDLPALERLVKLLPRFGPAWPQPIRDGIYDALARTGDEKAVTLIVRASIRQNAVLAAQAIKSMGATGESGLRKAVDDPDPFVQQALPGLFALAGMKDNIQFLRALRDLKSDDKARRIAGATELTRTPVDDARREEVAGLLRPHIDAEDVALRNTARDALIRWAAKDDVPTLVKILGGANVTAAQRVAIIQALGASKDAKAVEALVPLLGGQDTFHAEQALAKIGRDAAEKPVRKLIDSTDLKVRTAATRALRGMGVKDNFDFDAAWADARSDDVRRRNAGLFLLANSVTVPDEKKADVLKLADKLKDDADITTRIHAINLLARHATKDEVPTLLKLMEGKAEGQRGLVIQALGRLKEKKAIPLIVKSLGETHERALAERALVDIGSASEKSVLEELKGDKILVRLACVRVLAQVGTKESLPALEAITKETGARSRALVNEATKAIDAIKKRQ